jgi:hypothetical protein
MQRYIEQLIDDLHKATWRIKPPHKLWGESDADPTNELELEDMSYVEKYIYGDALPISEITGIAREQLPPVEKLNQDQQALLADELEKLLQIFHFHLDFPQGYPNHLRYPFIRDFWSEEQIPLSFGENHIEFCNYDEENCPFRGYCQTCNEIAEQMKYDESPMNNASYDVDIEDLLPDVDLLENFWYNADKKESDDDDADNPDENTPI